MDVAILIQLCKFTPTLDRVVLDQLEVVAPLFLLSDDVLEVIHDGVMESKKEPLILPHLLDRLY